MDINTTYNMDCLEGLRAMDDCSIDCCVTSPPYFALRDYGCDGQLGLERSPEEYIEKLGVIFAEILRVMKPDATCWVVMGDTYAGAGKGAAKYPENAKKYKQGTNVGTLDKAIAYKFVTEAKDRDLIGLPWMLAFALRRLGFYLRQDIIWHKTNPMPEPVKSRCVKAHEYIFLLSKSRTYYFDSEAIKERAVTAGKRWEIGSRQRGLLVPGQKYEQFRGGYYFQDEMANKRDVWSIALKQTKSSIHHATFPEELPTLCILAGCPDGGIVLDPFMGSGTTAIAALKLGRNFLGFELNTNYCDFANRRVAEFQKQLRLF